MPVRVADENGISERRRCYGVGFGGHCPGTRSEQNVCCRPYLESVEARLVCGAQQVVAQQRLARVVHQTEIGICRAEPLARDSHEIALRRAESIDLRKDPSPERKATEAGQFIVLHDPHPVAERGPFLGEVRANREASLGPNNKVDHRSVESDAIAGATTRRFRSARQP